MNEAEKLNEKRELLRIFVSHLRENYGVYGVDDDVGGNYDVMLEELFAFVDSFLNINDKFFLIMDLEKELNRPQSSWKDLHFRINKVLNQHKESE